MSNDIYVKIHIDHTHAVPSTHTHALQLYETLSIKSLSTHLKVIYKIKL